MAITSKRVTLSTQELMMLATVAGDVKAFWLEDVDIATIEDDQLACKISNQQVATRQLLNFIEKLTDDVSSFKDLGNELFSSPELFNRDVDNDTDDHLEL